MVGELEGSPFVDWTVLESLRGLQGEGQPSLVAELVQLFISDTPMRLDAIRQAVGRRDPDALAFAAHTLKGGCATLGATRMRDLSLGLEQLGRAGGTDGAPELLVALDAAFGVTRATLERGDPG